VQDAPAAQGKFAPFDLTYLVGAGPQGILGIRPAEMAKGLPANKAAADARALLKLFLTQGLAQCFECDLTAAEPPRVEDFEECILGVSCVAALPSAKEQGSLTSGLCSPCMLRTTKPFDWAGALNKWFPKAEKRRRAGRDYLRMPFSADVAMRFLPLGKGQVGIFVPDDRTVVFGNEGQIRELLGRLKAGKPVPTPPGWKEFDRDLIALAFDTRTIRCVNGEWPKDSPEAQHARTLVEGIGVLAAGVTLADRTEVRLTALAKDSETASKAVNAIQQLLASVRQGLVARAKDGKPTQAVKLLQEALEKVDIARDGDRVRVRAGVGCNVLGVLAAALEKGAVSTASPSPQVPAVDERLTLAVANCRKEEVVLFRVDGTGELTFMGKVQAGEAADVLTRPGERWLAVFLSGPYKEQHVASRDCKVWLLRPETASPAVPPPNGSYLCPPPTLGGYYPAPRPGGF
jgi:hypothetical protein